MKINEILNIKYPFIQGGMANISDGRFAAAVSNAGGLGIIASGGLTASELRENIRICRSLTDKPFGVNIIMLHREIDEIAEIVIEEKVSAVTTGAGNPEKYIKKWKAEGIKVIPVVSSEALARKMEQIGADMIIAEGQESGGHIGELSTMVLTPLICSKVSIPVIAAGGIATGKQILASEVLGASGVQMGTVFLGTEECPVHEKYKEKIVRAKSSNTTVIGLINGMATRLLKNPMSKKYIELEKKGATKEELELYTFGALRKSVKEGDLINGSIMAGQVVEEVKEIVKTADLLERLYNDYLSEREKIKCL